jgi:hypothetical protein
MHDPTDDFGFTFTDTDAIVKKNNLVSADSISQLETDNIRLRKDMVERLQTLEALIIPLLKNLLKNPDKEYIHWKDREEPIRAQIDKIMEITRKPL